MSDVLDGPADLQFAVVGVGINADHGPGDLDADRPVTTVRRVVGPVDPTEVAVALRENLPDRAAAVESEEGFAALRGEWIEAAVTLGERIVVRRRGEGSLAGVARGLDEAGGLIVETERGRSSSPTASANGCAGSERSLGAGESKARAKRRGKANAESRKREPLRGATVRPRRSSRCRTSW